MSQQVAGDRFWTSAQLKAAKTAIKEELDQVEASGSRRDRLALAVQRVGELGEDTTGLGMLRRFVYAMSALVHQERFGGLRERQTRDLLALAHAILQLRIPNPSTSRLGSLYGDYHLLRSQLLRKEGRHWHAAWEQQMSIHVSGRLVSQGQARQLVAAAIRVLRLGHGMVAEDLFRRALHVDLPPALMWRCRLGLIQILRLSRQVDACRREIQALLRDPAIPSQQRLECEWEGHLLDATAEAAYAPLLKAVGPRGTHHQSGYFLEAYLLVHAAAREEWSERIARVRSMARGRALKANSQGMLFLAAMAVETCHDRNIPFVARLAGLGDRLAQRHQLITIDKELLLLAAAIVWLARSQAFGLANLVLSEYYALSLRLSGQNGADALGILSAYYDKPWFTGLRRLELPATA